MVKVAIKTVNAISSNRFLKKSTKTIDRRVFFLVAGVPNDDSNSLQKQARMMLNVVL